MKKILYILIAVFAVSCQDITDLKPLDAIGEETAFSTPELIELSMNGVYDAAQSGFYGTEGNNRGYIFGAAHVQQNEMRGEDMLLINIFYAFTYEATYNATTANNVNYWENGFRLINLANLFIEGVTGAVEAGVIDANTGNEYIAEARFLRAMAYHEMVIMFARPYSDDPSGMGLPIFDFGFNSGETVGLGYEIGRSTIQETYDFILADLDFAEDNAPETRSGSQNVTRVTSGAAVALKTRVYLHMEDYANVITEGNKLVSGATAPFTSPINGYALTASVEGPWADNESSDNILSMAMGVNDNLNVNAALCNMLGTGDYGARGEVAISPLLWNQTWWHPDDLRRTMSTAADNGMVASGASGRLFTNKYRDYTNNTDYAPIMRYAEVLLNLSEAEALGGSETRSLALLNAVRDRAVAGAMTSHTGLTGSALTDAIAQERRIELAFEGFRWKDIHRAQADIPAKMSSADVSGATYAIGSVALTTNVASRPYSDNRYLWPIPASETTRNPIMLEQQNPGY